MRHKTSLLIKYGVSLGLLVFILVQADLSSTLSAVRDVSLGLFGLALLINAANMVVRSYKWQILVKALGSNPSLMTLQKLNYISLFFNNFFLGSFGGDAYRIYRAVDYSHSATGAASSVMMERLTGLVTAIGLMLALSIMLISTTLGAAWLKITSLLLLLTILVSPVVYLSFRLRARLLGFRVLRRFPKIKQLSDGLAISFQVYRGRPWAVTAALILSIVFHLVNGLKIYYLVKAVNADASVLSVIFVSILVGVIALIPISLNGLGIQEGSYVFYLEQVGVAGPLALLVAVLSRIVVLVFSLIGGLFFLTYLGSRSGPQSINCRSGTTDPHDNNELQ